jgi:hypothetical protein
LEDDECDECIRGSADEPTGFEYGVRERDGDGE